jgi:chromosome segregation ATPase
MNLEMLEEQNKNLEAQLVALYQEKQHTGDPTHLLEALKSLEEQVCSFYSDRESNPADVASMRDSMKSLEEQLVALYEERSAFQEKVHAIERKMEDMKAKSKAIGAALLEAALFGDERRVA